MGCARKGAFVGALGVTLAWLGSGCCRSDGLESITAASGPIPIDASERAWVDLVVCRAGACSQGTLDGPPYAEDNPRRGDIATLAGAADVECEISDRTGQSPVWFLYCMFGMGSGGTPDDEDIGDTEPVWIEIRLHATQGLLLHVDGMLTYEGHSTGDGPMCGDDVWGSMTW
jgi:hypothetical protein